MNSNLTAALTSLQELRRHLLPLTVGIDDNDYDLLDHFALEAIRAIERSIRSGLPEETIYFLDNLLPEETITMRAEGATYVDATILPPRYRAVAGRPSRALPTLARLFADLEQASPADTLPAPPAGEP